MTPSAVLRPKRQVPLLLFRRLVPGLAAVLLQLLLLQLLGNGPDPAAAQWTAPPASGVIPAMTYDGDALGWENGIYWGKCYQMIYVEGNVVTVDESTGDFEFTVKYETDATTSGNGYRLHWDSSKVEKKVNEATVQHADQGRNSDNCNRVFDECTDHCYNDDMNQVSTYKTFYGDEIEADVLQKTDKYMGCAYYHRIPPYGTDAAFPKKTDLVTYKFKRKTGVTTETTMFLRQVSTHSGCTAIPNVILVPGSDGSHSKLTSTSRTCGDTDADGTPDNYDCSAEPNGLDNTNACSGDSCTAEECCTVIPRTCGDTNADGTPDNYDCSQQTNGLDNTNACSGNSCLAAECCTVIPRTCADTNADGTPDNYDCSQETNGLDNTNACSGDSCLAAECCTVIPRTCADTNADGTPDSYDCSQETNGLDSTNACSGDSCSAEECCTVADNDVSEGNGTTDAEDPNTADNDVSEGNGTTDAEDPNTDTLESTSSKESLSFTIVAFFSGAALLLRATA